MFSTHSLLRANAASCLGFGGLFVAVPGLVSHFLSQNPAPQMVVIAVGALLLVNGLHLLLVARAEQPETRWLIYFSLGDLAWVALTVGLIAAGTWITSSVGIVTSLAVAALVGFFGVAQLAVARSQSAQEVLGGDKA